MTALVVDASVAIKWFVPEVQSEAAERLLSGEYSLLAPELITAEVGNTLWKKIGRGEIMPAQGLRILETFGSIGIELYPTALLAQAALELACALRCTVYDALYLALAVAHDCAVITADRKFHAAIAASTLRHRARFLDDPL